MVESSPAVDGPNVMIFRTGTAVISLPFAIDKLSQEEIFCAIDMNFWTDGKLSAAE